jgi:RNA polymerase sigma-70 factor (ECF subfamily)
MLADSVFVRPIADTKVLDEAGDPAELAAEKETLRLAFVAALQHLPARQRAVLILRDVLGFSAREVAATLDATPASIDTALGRARRTVEERLPARSQQATLRELGDVRLRELVGEFVAAWERADVDAVVGLLTDDAVIAMPPRASWFRGREAVATFLRGWPLAPGARWRLVPTSANGQPAVGEYLWDRDSERFVAHAITVLTLDGSRIADITGFIGDEGFERFGLPR